jgi:hypothetical protein
VTDQTDGEPYLADPSFDPARTPGKIVLEILDRKDQAVSPPVEMNADDIKILFRGLEEPLEEMEEWQREGWVICRECRDIVHTDNAKRHAIGGYLCGSCSTDIADRSSSPLTSIPPAPRARG